MPTIKITVTVGAKTVGRTVNVSAEHLQRLLTARKDTVFERDAQWGSIRPVTDPTDEQIILAWADSLLDRTKREVKNFEAKAAMAATPDVSFT